jgi:4-hydroxyphenylpyruvate dioxygenase
VPDNHYADLAARFALPLSFVDGLREHGILCDRGGYDGFGDVNAPVRMAAHRYRRLTSPGIIGA